MRQKHLLPSFALLVAISPAFAQADLPGLSGAEASIAQFERLHGTAEMSHMDMTQSGVEELLIRAQEPCPEDGCAWQLLSSVDGQARIVGQGQGTRLRLEPTLPAGAVLFTDGVTWALQEQRLIPYGDDISMSPERATSQEDFRHIEALGLFPDISIGDVSSWTIEYLIDDASAFAHVHVITASDYRIGHWGSPYLMLDNDGAMITQGLSTEIPRVFVDPEIGGFVVVEVLPAGVSVQEFR